MQNGDGVLSQKGIVAASLDTDVGMTRSELIKRVRGFPRTVDSHEKVFHPRNLRDPKCSTLAMYQHLRAAWHAPSASGPHSAGDVHGPRVAVRTQERSVEEGVPGLGATLGTCMQATEINPSDEVDWEEVKRLRRPARVWGEEDAVLVMLRGKKRKLRKTVLVPDNLTHDGETAAILDQIVHKRLFGDW